MICPFCQAGIPENSNFCTYCGGALSPQATTPEYRHNVVGHNVVGTNATRRFYLDFGKLLGDSFELYKRHFGTFCLVGLLLFGIPFIINIFGTVLATAIRVGGLAMLADAPAAALFAFSMGIDAFFSILQMLTQCYLTLGAIRQGLHIARGGSGFQAHLMFPPFVPFLKIVAIYILVGCISFGIVLLFALPIIAAFGFGAMVGFLNDAPEDAMIAAIIASILFGFVGFCILLWVNVRLWFAEFFLADRDTGVIESLAASWQSTRGNFWILFLAIIVLGVLSCLGFLLCLVGIVLTIAFVWLGGVLAYMQLTGQPNCLDYVYVPEAIEQPEQFKENQRDNPQETAP